MVTLKAIADKVGCSISVASRALNPDVAQHRTVAVSTAQKIINAAEKLGYQTRNGKSRHKAAGVIGVFLPLTHTSLVMDLLIGMTTEANNANTPLYFYFGLRPEDYRSFAEKYGNVNHSVGMITYFPELNQPLISEIKKTIKILEKHNGKVVILQTRPEPELNLPSVTVDNFHGGYMAGDYLAKKECSEYFCIYGGAKYRSKRFIGFQQAMYDKKCNFTAFQKAGIDNDTKEIDRIINKILKISDLSEKHKLGIFIDADPVALIAIECLNKAGIKVGKQVLIVGYDDIYSSSLLTSGLTTVRQPFSEVGKIAMCKIISLLKGYPESSVVINPELIIRNSA